MRASIGDWLIVRTRGEHQRRGVICAARPDGSPPYTVRWTDDGHETVVFPGPDAIVLSPADLAEAERAENARIDEMQAAIKGADRPA